MRTPNLVIGPDSAGQLEDIERDLNSLSTVATRSKRAVKINQYTGLVQGRKPRRKHNRKA